MNVKSLLKKIIFFIIFVSIIFSISIYWFLQSYRQALQKTDIAKEIVLQVVQRRVLADEYLFHPVDRAKQQWLTKQSNLQKIINTTAHTFQTSEEKQQITQIQTGFLASERVFQQLVLLQGKDSIASDSATYQEQKNRLSSQLSIKAQETISAASKLVDINTQRAKALLQQIITVFSLAASLFFLMLLGSFWFIWRSAVQLEQSNRKLKDLDKLKDEFVSVASHELRTPMTAIKGFVSMMLEGDYGSIPNELKEPLEDIQSSTERLIHLVNDMLNVSRIEAGRLKFSLQNIDSNHLIEEVVSSLQPIAKEKGLILSSSTGTVQEVQADSDKVKQLLNNLIGNSLKFTDGGSITVSSKEESGFVKISVTDTGMGMKKEDQSILFGKFQQIATQATGKPTGTGLGLFISRELARKMGGDLWLEWSEIEKGSTFSFTLPIASSQIATKVKQQIDQEAQNHPDQKNMN